MYAENTNPRDIMFAYLRTEIRKPHNVDPGAHASRVETLCRLSNRLQGTEAELTEIQIRKLVFETFPAIWQTEYYKSQREFATDTIQGIIGYMNLCKGSADTDEERRKKKRKPDDTPRAHGGNKNDKNKNKGNWKNKLKEAKNKPCTVPHANYKFHLWKDCSLNPKSTNFRFSSQSSGRSDGRGNYNNGGRTMGGRFNGGRGNGSGRFGNGRGYSGGRGNFQNHSNNENNWMGQPNDRQRGTPQDHYHYNNGPQGRGGWHAGGNSNGQSSSYQKNDNYYNQGGW
jgi:hypothetical protein